MLNFIEAQWPAHPAIRAMTTTRAMGFFSQRAAQNDPLLQQELLTNQQSLCQTLALPSKPAWLQQVHGTEVIQLPNQQATSCVADGAYTQQPNTVCAVTTADCLPVFLTSTDGTEVAVLHAGWRGLAAGIIEKGIQRFSSRQLLAWLGPAIGPAVFEVGDEVRDQFMAADSKAATAFTPSPQQRWLADLYTLAKQRLTACGVTHIFGGEHCTYTETNLFFSYRREKENKQRIGMASLIWIDV